MWIIENFAGLVVAATVLVALTVGLAKLGQGGQTW